MRFLLKVCAFFFAVGLLSLVLATANEVFNLGIWHDDYPDIFTFDEEGNQTPVGYGSFMLEFGAVTLGALLLGAVVQWRLRVREAEDLAAWLEDMDDEEQREFLATLEENRD